MSDHGSVQYVSRYLLLRAFHEVLSVACGRVLVLVGSGQAHLFTQWGRGSCVSFALLSAVKCGGNVFLWRSRSLTVLSWFYKVRSERQIAVCLARGEEKQKKGKTVLPGTTAGIPEEAGKDKWMVKTSAGAFDIQCTDRAPGCWWITSSLTWAAGFLPEPLGTEGTSGSFAKSTENVLVWRSPCVGLSGLFKHWLTVTYERRLCSSALHGEYKKKLP